MEGVEEVEWFRRRPTGGTVYVVDAARLGPPADRPNGGATVDVQEASDADQ